MVCLFEPAIQIQRIALRHHIYGGGHLFFVLEHSGSCNRQAQKNQANRAGLFQVVCVVLIGPGRLVCVDLIEQGRLVSISWPPFVVHVVYFALLGIRQIQRNA